MGGGGVTTELPDKDTHVKHLATPPTMNPARAARLLYVIPHDDQDDESPSSSAISNKRRKTGANSIPLGFGIDPSLQRKCSKSDVSVPH
jgi:hypothetical protein